MFDPSFFELIIICVVALLVLGPDRLPGAIKTMGLWIGRLRRSFNNIKREIEQEVGADEIRRQLRNEAIMEKFKNTKSQITESIDSVKKEADSVKDDLNLKKEFSGITEPADSSAQKDESNAPSELLDLDPIDNLPTNDPAVKSDKPATSADKSDTNDDSSNDTDTAKKQDKSSE